jgi:HD-GYP domain-containing protein (c-di-GMP phosphodiesterase class II)
VLRLTVVQGPDTGKSRTFVSGRIMIGRAPDVDFPLQDHTVSRCHAILELDPTREAFVYRDLDVRNASILRSGLGKTRSDDPKRLDVEIEGPAQIALGRTLLRAELVSAVEAAQLPAPARAARTRVPGATPLPAAPAAVVDHEARMSIDLAAPHATRPSGDGRVSAEDEQTRVLMRVRESAAPPEERLAGPLPAALYRLARQMNQLSRLEDILDLVAEASLEMFPLANFFAIAVPEDDAGGRVKPLVVRSRQDDSPRELHLSQSLIRQVIENREAILYIRDPELGSKVEASIVRLQIASCLCAPLFGQRKLMGVMQLDSRGRGGMFTDQELRLFTAIASSVAFAMERAELVASIYEMFEGFVHASVAAIEARDPTTAGHSQRVADFTLMMASRLNGLSSGPLAAIKFQPNELTELRYAALLHDFGKIGVREVILQKPSRLLPDQYRLVVQRLEILRALRHREIVADGFAQILREGRTARPGELEALERRYLQECDHLDRYLLVLQELQQPRPLRPGEREAIHEMAAIRFLDSRGQEQKLLTDEDVENLLIRAGSLNPWEREHVQTHAALTRDYLSRIPWGEEFKRIPYIAGLHHEKLNGKGYPAGVDQQDLPSSVRILSICDIFDALTAADRPYKKAKPVSYAVDILSEEVEQGALDGQLVRFFVEAIIPEIEERYLLRPR